MEEIRKICEVLKPIFKHLKTEMNFSGQRLHEYFGIRLVIASKEDSYEKFLDKLLSLCGYTKLDIKENLNYKRIRECPFLISAMMEE